MTNFYWKLRFEGENVAEIRIPTEYTFCANLQQSGSAEVRELVTFNGEEVEIPNSRGTANLVLNFGGKHASTINILKQLPKGKGAPNPQAPQYGVVDGPEKKCLVAAFECRGVDITELKVGAGFTVVSTSGTVFRDCDLSADWADYCPKSQECVVITKIDSFVETQP